MSKAASSIFNKSLAGFRYRKLLDSICIVLLLALILACVILTGECLQPGAGAAADSGDHHVHRPGQTVGRGCCRCRRSLPADCQPDSLRMALLTRSSS